MLSCTLWPRGSESVGRLALTLLSRIDLSAFVWIFFGCDLLTSVLISTLFSWDWLCFLAKIFAWAGTDSAFLPDLLASLVATNFPPTRGPSSFAPELRWFFSWMFRANGRGSPLFRWVDRLSSSGRAEPTACLAASNARSWEVARTDLTVI